MRAVAAVNGPVAARTRFLGSFIRSASAEPTKGGRVRRHGLTVANFFANDRNCLTEKKSSPMTWVVGTGIIRPETNASHWVLRADFSQKLVVRAQKMNFHGWIFREFGVGAR